MLTRDVAVVVAAVKGEAEVVRRGGCGTWPAVLRHVGPDYAVSGGAGAATDPEDVVQALNGGGVAVWLAAVQRAGGSVPVVAHQGVTLRFHAAQVTLQGTDGVMAALGMAAGCERLTVHTPLQAAAHAGTRHSAAAAAACALGVLTVGRRGRSAAWPGCVQHS